MKTTLKKELFGKLRIMIFLILLIVLLGLSALQVQRMTSDKIATEYYEMNSIHDLNYFLNKIIILENKYFSLKDKSFFEEFQSLLKDLVRSYEHCKKTLTINHSRDLIENIQDNINEFKKVANIKPDDFNQLSDFEINKIIVDVFEISVNVDKEIYKFQNETKSEIDEYISINRTISSYGFVALILIGIIIILVGVIWGKKFIRKMTVPIMQLIDFTQKVADGNFDVKSEIRFGNELDKLTRTFNDMVEKLNHTTVSKNYFNSILSSMNDSLIVTDKNGIIKLSNNSANSLFQCDEGLLLGKHINNYLNIDLEEVKENNELHENIKNIEMFINKKKQEQVPVLISLSEIKRESERSDDMIIVIRDISEKIRIEKQLEKERKERIVAIIEAQEDAKFRIASDLHDGLGQMLTGIKYFIDNSIADKISVRSELYQNLEIVNARLDAAIKETKNIAHDIIPILLKDFGLVVAVRKLVMQINSLNKLKIQVADFNFETRLEPKLEKLLYRLCQEAINNAVKHSNATIVNVHFIKHSDSVVLLVEDDGVGFDVNNKLKNQDFSGIGLITMNERVSAHNGTISINSQIKKGTEILIEIPFQSYE